MDAGSTDGTDDAERLADRAVAGVTRLARRATAFATRLLLFVSVLSIGGFLLGLAALSGGIETVWIVLGIVFAAIAVGAAVTARWRLGSVRRHVPELADEVRSMLRSGHSSGRTVVETFVVDDDRPDDVTGRSVMVFGRNTFDVRGLASSGAESTARITAAVTAFTSLPFLALVAIGISLVFGFLGLIFLVALAL